MGGVANDESPRGAVDRRGPAVLAVASIAALVVATSAVIEPDASVRASIARGAVCALCVLAAGKAWDSRRFSGVASRVSFGAFAGGFLVWGVSIGLGEAFARLAHRDERVPSLANFFALAFPVLVTFGFARYGGRTPSPRLAIRQMSDWVLVAVGTTMVFVVAFGVLGESGYMTLRSFAMIHAVAFVAAAGFAAISLGYRAYPRGERNVLGALAVSAACVAVVEVERARAILESGPLFGRWSDGFAALGPMTFIAACVAHDHVSSRSSAAAPALPSPVDLAIPVVLASACASILAFADETPPTTMRWFAVVGLFLVVALIVRSVVVARISASLRAEIAAHERTLAAANHVESLGLLASGLAHDFNNLLTALLANIGLLRARASSASQDDTSLELMEQSTLRAAELAKRLMSLARPHATDPRPVRPNEIVHRIGVILRAAVPSRIHVDILGDDSNPCAMLDPGQLEQALLQLGLNSSQAIPERGRIVIAVRCHGDSVGRFITFSVTDDGIGMSKATRAKVRNSVFTTRGDRGGAGLGLALVRTAVRAHGGTLELASNHGRGSRIEMRLPLVPVAEPAEPRRAERILSSGFETILVVDDRASSLLALRATLELSGYQVVATTRPDEVSGILESERIAMIVTDLDMPGTSGSELVRRLREDGCSLPILLITGASREAADASGADAVVEKPFEVMTLLHVVRRVLERRGTSSRSEVA